MNALSEKFKNEWDFFINPKTQKIQYNKKCNSCTEECKQSYRVKIFVCLQYIETEQHAMKRKSRR